MHIWNLEVRRNTEVAVCRFFFFFLTTRAKKGVDYFCYSLGRRCIFFFFCFLCRFLRFYPFSFFVALRNVRCFVAFEWFNSLFQKKKISALCVTLFFMFFWVAVFFVGCTGKFTFYSFLLVQTCYSDTFFFFFVTIVFLRQCATQQKQLACVPLQCAFSQSPASTYVVRSVKLPVHAVWRRIVLYSLSFAFTSFWFPFLSVCFFSLVWLLIL